jgi:flagellar motor switch protein FliN/FliY
MAEDTEKIVQDVAAAADSVVQATENASSEIPHNMDFLLDVTLTVGVEVGRTRMTIQDLLQLGQGSVIELAKLAGEPLDIYVNDRLVARGEAVIVNEKFGVRVTDILSQHDRLQSLG